MSNAKTNMTRDKANSIVRDILARRVKPSELVDFHEDCPDWFFVYTRYIPYSQRLFKAVKACDDELRLRLCHMGNVMVACHVAHAGDKICDRELAKSKSDIVRCHVAMASNDNQTLDTLAKDPNEQVVLYVLSHRRQKDATLLSTHPSKDVRAVVAEFATDPKIIESLANDKCAYVRSNIAARGLMLDKLMHDRADSVLYTVIVACAENNKPIPGCCLDKLSKSKSWNVRRWATSGDYARHEDAMHGLSDKDRWVRYHLAFDTKYQDVLDELKHDNDEEIRDIAISRNVVSNDMAD